ncbi:GntR family transcriptional regulator [Pseudomonas mangiferae]|uniref:GntR family transcriptional regulator n=1 Tax=Pseudomonas mangiferae TaxID=2593654 RepID=A0A553H2F7_9PSED|nr:GntR family transcriptional regulator [Pseudomonas mangiferae]TRX75947.1 GntR family transcriptional regulator [Pseudomonas mangiferae]
MKGTSHPTSLQVKLASQILSAIQSGEFAAGRHLKEVELASRFGVSRSPIRGALAYLASRSLIEPLPQQGYGVPRQLRTQRLPTRLPLSEDEELYRRLLGDRMARRLPDQIMESDVLRRYGVGKATLRRCLLRLSEEGVIQRRHGHGWLFLPTLNTPQKRYESYRYRMLVEPAALLEDSFGLCGDRLRQCRQRHLDLLAALPDGSGFFAANSEFHELLAASSGNSYILQAVRQQNRLLHLSESLRHPNPEDVRLSCREHLAILDALEQGENEWAATLMHRHLEVSSRRHHGADGQALDDGEDLAAEGRGGEVVAQAARASGG